MDCPVCKAAMTSGDISLVATTPVTDLILGESGGSFAVQFQDQNQQPTTVMNPGDSQPAFYCDSCGAFVITGAEYTDIQCLVCKAVIPAGTTSCLKCGWTYKDG